MIKRARVAFLSSLLFFGGTLASSTARGDGLGLSLRFDHAVYIIGESIDAVLQVSNKGATPFIIDDYGAYRDNRVHFEVRRQRAETVDPLGDESVVKKIMLMPDETRAFRVDLSAFFPLARESRYQVRAKVIHDGTAYLSAPVIFDVAPGMLVLEKTHILPGSRGVRRTYKLVYWPRGNTEQLFLRAFDEPGKGVWQTLRLGPLVRNNPVRLDFEGNLIKIRRQVSRDIFMETEIESYIQGLRIVGHSQSEDFTTTPLRRMLNPNKEEAPEGDRAE